MDELGPTEQDLDAVMEELLSSEVRLRLDEQKQFRRALSTSRQIGMAIGLLMGLHHMSADAAFAVLVRTSRDNNVKLRDVAAGVVQHRELPDQSPG